jgi:hypothetical protein
MHKIAQAIRQYVDSGSYSDALQLGLKALADGDRDPQVMNSMLLLTATLRSTCMDLASRKRDCSDTYLSLEALLRRANAVTGEDMYGRVARSDQT